MTRHQNDRLNSLLSGALRFVTRTPVLGLALRGAVPSLVAQRALLHRTAEVQQVACAKQQHRGYTHWLSTGQEKSKENCVSGTTKGKSCFVRDGVSSFN